MRKYRIYILPATFVLWFLLFRFHVSLLNVFLAAIQGVAAYVLVGSCCESAPTENPCGEQPPGPENLDDLLDYIKGQLNVLKDTSAEIEIQGICKNVSELKRLVDVHPEHTGNVHLNRFMSLYKEYSDILADYLPLQNIAVPSESADRVQALCLERFRMLRSASAAILNRFYRMNSWNLEAENKALDQILARLEDEKTHFSITN